MRRHRKLLVVPVVLGLFLVAGVGTASADFVCPVFSGDSGAVGKNKHLVPISNGDYTIFPGAAGEAPDGVGVEYPDQATNTNADGSTGDPGGAHASPGQPGYTPLWDTP